jgi:hypothetical protein
MSPSRHFVLALTLLLGPATVLARAPLGAQIAVNGTAVVTFSVPVQVASVDPKFTQLNVVCVVQGGTATGAANPLEARGTVAMTNGGYSGTVPVQVTLNASSGQSWSYHCVFNLLDSVTGKYWVVGSAIEPLPPAAEGHLAALMKPGTPLAIEQRGTFTVQ